MQLKRTFQQSSFYSGKAQDVAELKISQTPISNIAKLIEKKIAIITFGKLSALL